jgi:hypothetical protein
VVQANGAAFAKRTSGSAKRPFKYVVAIPTQNLLAGITGHPFGFGIEKIYFSLQIVGDNALFQVVQYAHQVLTTGNGID